MMTRRTGRLALLLLAVLAARVPGQEPKRETVEVSNSALLTLRVGKAGRSVQLPGKVRFVLGGDAVGAFLQADIAYWREWNGRNVKRLKQSQQADGSMNGNNGATFRTSASLLSLALNDRFLPICER